MEYSRFELHKLARPLDMSTNLASCAHYTLIDFSLIVDLSRPLRLILMENLCLYGTLCVLVFENNNIDNNFFSNVILGDQKY